MNDYRSDYQPSDIRTYEQLFSSWIPPEMLGDFFLRLDLLCVSACIHNTSAEVYMQGHWDDFFSQPPLDDTLLTTCMDYCTDWILGLKLRSKGTHVRSRYIQERAIMVVTVIASITRENILDAAAVTQTAAKKTKESIGSYNGMEQNLNNVTDRYYRDRVPMAETAGLLESMQSDIQALLTEMLLCYAGKEPVTADAPRAPREPRRRESSGEKQQPEIIFQTPAHFMGVMLMMYHVICHRTPEATVEECETLMQNQWALLFCSIPYTARAKQDFYRFVDSVPNLKNLKLLWEFPLRQIRSEVIIRSIVIPLCVNYVLSKLPPRTSADVVVDEALMRFENFKTLSVGKEGIDTVEYVNRFRHEAGYIDEHITQLVSEHEDLIAEMFRLCTVEIEARDRSRKDLARTVNRQEAELKQLQSEKELDLESVRLDTRYQLIKQLNSPVYNYLLSRLYRVAYDFDAISETDTRLLLRDLFQVLKVNGVTTVGSDLIGLPADSEKLDGISVVCDNVQKVPEGYVVFPGWDVSGNSVSSPIVSKTFTEEDEEG